MKSFLGVTGHYISNEWKLESVMLSCNRISGRHTGENILQSYEEVASEFNQRLSTEWTGNGLINYITMTSRSC